MKWNQTFLRPQEGPGGAPALRLFGPPPHGGPPRAGTNLIFHLWLHQNGPENLRLRQAHRPFGGGPRVEGTQPGFDDRLGGGTPPSKR